MHGNAKNIKGIKFGRLTPYWPTNERSGNSVKWVCLCDCGSFTLVGAGSLKSGHTKSCGCLMKEVSTKNMIAIVRNSFGKNNVNWHGGYRKNGHYYSILCPNHPYAGKKGYVPEHRLVIEKYLGYYLSPFQIVHHINYDKHDNRLENLMVFNSTADHIRFHMLYDKRIRRNQKSAVYERGKE